jgi:hypothetical protein
MSYPADWPRCPVCGNFALDGHITCGDVHCNEGEQRRLKAEAWRRANAWINAKPTEPERND